MDRTELTADRLKELLAYDPLTGIFNWKVDRYRVMAGDEAGTPDPDGYVLIGIDGRKHKAHRLAWFYMTGKWPEPECDHRDLDKSNNSFGNLRECTTAQNQQNRGPQANNTSGHKGVSWNKATSKWSAFIKVSGKQKYLGVFATVEEAVSARRAATRKFHPFCEVA